MNLRRYVFLALFCFSTVALADVIRSGSMQASSDGVNVTLHWITDDETNVARFDIERRSGTDAYSPWMPVATVDAKGPSAYEYVDNSAFQKTSTIYQYRVKISYTNTSNVTYSQIVTITHTVSGVRRTWGSIKSMFR